MTNIKLQPMYFKGLQRSQSHGNKLGARTSFSHGFCKLSQSQ